MILRRGLLLGGVLAIVLVALAGCMSSGSAPRMSGSAGGGGAGSGTGTSKSFVVKVTENGFNGQTGLVLRVHQGDHVHMTFVSAEGFGDEHPILLTCYGLSARVTKDDTDAATSNAQMDFTADKTGTCGFSCQNSECHIHPKLQDAKLIVES